jgi:ribosomal protein L40E
MLGAVVLLVLAIAPALLLTKCPKCGARNLLDSAACRKCGHVQPEK